MEAFLQGLRESGFTPGKNVIIELRYGAKDTQEFASQAAELVRMKVALVVAFGDSAPKTVQETSSVIPIVAMSDDLLGSRPHYQPFEARRKHDGIDDTVSRT
jgi:hypothetical protein